MTDIVINNLNKGFGDKRVLSDFSAVIKGGGHTCIMGHSGCGKTTLLRILAGFESPDGGGISGVPDKISFVFQEDRLCEDFNAVSNIRFVTGKAVSKEKIISMLCDFGLGDSLKKPVKRLSGGMKRRVAIARALLAPYDMLVMDEPFKGFDAELKRTIIGYVNKSTEGKTVILVTHDIAEAEAFGGNIIKMGDAYEN